MSEPGGIAFAVVGNGRQLHQDLTHRYEQWARQITVRRDSAVWKVIPQLLSQPVVTIRPPGD